MARKNLKDLVAALNAHIDRLEAAVDDRVAGAVAFAVRERMLQLVSRGISPILGAGRFPEYKAVSEGRKQGTQARVARNLARSTRNASRAQQARNASKRIRSAARAAKRGYPYSVQNEFPDKKPRPVNLTLSGDFLRALEIGFSAIGKRVRFAVGFYDEAQAKKERGHREGANGQRKRPIIPKGQESFAETIKADIFQIVRQAVRNAAKFRKE